ncbi:MAG: hypothetical protein JWM53_87 [bacterium]|nr:hypothetical protein [bacterium]
MANRASAGLIVATILWCGSTARGQPAAIGVQDADPEPIPAAEPLLAPPPPPPTSSCCCCPHLVLDPTEREAIALIAAGAAAAAVGYLFSTVYLFSQPHSQQAVDAIPIAGGIIAAARGRADDRDTPLLLFAAGVQAIGTLLAATAGAELAAQRRLSVEVGASPCGGGVAVTWRY